MQVYDRQTCVYWCVSLEGIDSEQNKNANDLLICLFLRVNNPDARYGFVL
jgi:hypothetical protein